MKLTPETVYLPELLYGADGVFREGLGLGVNVEGRITRVAPEGEFAGLPVQRFPGCAIFPGLTDTHCHAFQSLVRGIADDRRLEDWLRVVHGASEHLGAEEVYLGSLAAFLELLLGGATTVVDFFYLNGRGNENARAVARAARDAGIRLVLARSLLDAPRSNANIREEPATALERARECIRALDAAPDVRVCLAPHSLYACSERLLEGVFALGRELDVPVHIHFEDSAEGTRALARRYGRHAAHVVRALGGLNERLVAVHCIGICEEEIDLFAEAGVKVAHNPHANMAVGERVPDVARMLSRGLTVGLGTDGGCSNNSLSMIREVQEAALLQKARHQDPTALTAPQVLTMATRMSAAVAGVDAGTLEAGRLADFLLLDLSDPSCWPTARMASHAAYALSERAVRSVFVGGRPVILDRKPVRLDLHELRRRLDRSSAQAFGWEARAVGA